MVRGPQKVGYRWAILVHTKTRKNITLPYKVHSISDIITFILQIAWLRVDTQTILTIQSHVVTKNHRIVVTHSDHRTWYLHIKETRETDRGWYMCQVNTEPMKNQVAYLEVVGE